MADEGREHVVNEITKADFPNGDLEDWNDCWGGCAGGFGVFRMAFEIGVTAWTYRDH